MTWKKEIKKDDEDYKYRNYDPRDSVESMIDQIQDLCNEISEKSEESHALERPKMLAYCINELSEVLSDIRGY